MTVLLAALIISAPWHPLVPLVDETEIPTDPTAEAALHPAAPRYGPAHTGRATYYNLPGNRMGCGGVYQPGDPTIVAVPVSRYRTWPCGTRLQVSGPAGAIVGTRQDSCPGCDAHGVIVDLSVAAHRQVCGSGTCQVTVQEVY